MPDITSQPNSTTYQQLTPVPGGGSNHTKVDETIAAKSNADYVYDSVDFADYDQYGFPADSPADMDEVTEVDSHIYYQGIKVGVTEPGLRTTLYVGAVNKGAKLWATNTGGAWQVRHFRQTPSPLLSKSDYDSLDIRYTVLPGNTGYTPESS